MPNIRQQTIRGLQAGDTFRVARTFSEKDVSRFADITRDCNPVHFDAKFAKAKNFDGCICHGLLVASIMTEIGGQIGMLATRMDFHFKKPVYWGETIICDFTIVQVDERNRAEVKALYTNQNGTTVMEAFLTGIFPGPDEKKIMQSMI